MSLNLKSCAYIQGTHTTQGGTILSTTQGGTGPAGYREQLRLAALECCNRLFFFLEKKLI